MSGAVSGVAAFEDLQIKIAASGVDHGRPSTPAISAASASKGPDANTRDDPSARREALGEGEPDPEPRERPRPHGDSDAVEIGEGQAGLAHDVSDHGRETLLMAARHRLGLGGDHIVITQHCCRTGAEAAVEA